MLGIIGRTATILLDSLQRQHVGPCSESSRSSPARALLQPRGMLTTPIAVRRVLSEIFVSLRVAGREQRRFDRGGQDKSRKVRQIGRLGNASNFKHARNIATIPRNLLWLPRRCSSSVFDTFSRAK
jgi:hypothetical protein